MVRCLDKIFQIVSQILENFSQILKKSTLSLYSLEWIFLSASVVLFISSDLHRPRTWSKNPYICLEFSTIYSRFGHNEQGSRSFEFMLFVPSKFRFRVYLPVFSWYQVKAIGGKKYFSQINFNSCLNERSTFCSFKKCSTTSQLNSDLFLRFFKVRS